MDFKENGRIIFLKDFTIFTIFFAMFMFRENAYHTMHNTSRKERESESNRGLELTTLTGSKRESRDGTHKLPNLKAQSITNYSRKYMETTTGFTDTPERKYAEEACKAGKEKRIFGAIKPFVSPGIVSPP
ncbi:MAG: hypothetical protein HXS46_13160 [Theionarchaea archaeon]|nr:MAG: hypothetical protein AYK18_01485 [Theionarchaea archaeon DG-70]MBU7011631.1 hypothetical protein [Theionarchaea archaeon]